MYFFLITWSLLILILKEVEMLFRLIIMPATASKWFFHTIHMYLFFAFIFYFIFFWVCTFWFKLLVYIVIFLWNSWTYCITGKKKWYIVFTLTVFFQRYWSYGTLCMRCLTPNRGSVNIISFDNLGTNTTYYTLILYIKWYTEVI